MNNQNAAVQPLRFAATILSLIFLSACSSFDHDWNRSESQANAATDALIGRWAGTWRSEPTGHDGKLRCIITAATDSIVNQYVARYHATWWDVLSGEFTVPLAVEKQDGEYRFRGEFDLGMLAGGVYRYEGHVRAVEMHVNYVSKGDHGVYQLRKIAD